MATSASVSSFMIRPRGRFLPRASSSRQAASAFSRPSTSGLRLWILTRFQASAGIVDVIGRVGDPLHLLVEPVAAAGPLQPLEHLREQLGEMGDVADRIVDLALVERPPRPVGEARALVEAAAEQALDQVRIADLLAQPERHRRDLGVEQRDAGVPPVRLKMISMSWPPAWKTLSTCSLLTSRLSRGVRSIPSALGSIAAASSLLATWIRHRSGQ